MKKFTSLDPHELHQNLMRFRFFEGMRTWKRTTERGSAPPHVIDAAVEAHIDQRMSLAVASQQFKIPVRTLARYCAKKRNEKWVSNTEIAQQSYGYVGNAKVFTMDQECLLAEYVKKAADIYYGLSPKEVRKFAYQYANKNNLKMPSSWTRDEMAGPDWFSYFIKRHVTISIRTPEATSLARATSFNRHNITNFFANLKIVIERLNLTAQDIWNMDETGITTVQRPDRIVARRGMKQIGRMTSAERGSLVTLALAVSAGGNSIPPFFVFPRVNYKDHFVQCGPENSDGDSHPSGWMVEKTFLKFARHFVRYTRSTSDRPVLLLVDNHDSHLSVETLDYFKGNGVTVLSFPPHCSHKLQPLDRSVYGPLKKYVNTASDAWITENKTKTMNIYHIPSIVKTALPLAITPRNIKSGFQVSGIAPLNPEIFKDDDFMPSFVTDRPDPTVSQELVCPVADHSLLTAGTSAVTATFSSPEELRPFPKAGPLQPTKRGRKRRVTAILTDSPVKKALEKEQERKKQNRENNKKRNKKTTSKQPKQKNKIRKKIYSTSDEEDADEVPYAESEDSEFDLDEDHDDNLDENNDDNLDQDHDDEPPKQTSCQQSTDQPIDSDLSIGDYVVVSYGAKRYPGMITAIDKDDYLVSTMIKKGKFWSWPSAKDEIWYAKENVVNKIDPPVKISDTTFNVLLKK